MTDKLLALRHSAAHVMADAVKSLFPDVKLGIGPAIENGFYYDFDLEHRFTPQDLEKIEKKMQNIINKNCAFEKKELSKKEAGALFKEKGEHYKLELLDEIPQSTVNIYGHGDFIDLCKGPHVQKTGEIKAFKLLSIAGAYWRGNESNKMLQRIYGTAFLERDILDAYLEKLKEAEKRDHRKLGKELGLFSFFEEAGAGLVFYLPKGAILRKIIEDYIFQKHSKKNYQTVITPHILKSDLWKRSGHYDYYKENMYIFQSDNTEYAIKPMNCPGHILIYKSQRHSYRELPIKMFEAGTVYRNEKTGVLHGLLRVRGFTQDDAHIFCREDQLQQEIIDVILFTKEIMDDFGFKEFEIELSTRPEESIGSNEEWGKATAALINALSELSLEYTTHPGEGAFYGPKIDIKLKDALGRLWQCATIQCDFAGPERFDITYIGEDGKSYRTIMLHRAILGSLERFIGTLIEHYGGAFPLWLAPEQVRIIAISEKFLAYSENLKTMLDKENIRVTVDRRDETLGYKIRQAELEKIPYLLICGKKEEEAKTASVRSRKNGDEGSVELERLIKRLKEEAYGKTV
ncbi:MAG: threonine--tRNA ligase [Candidatus Saelkia tenebricola]|nr:threonine--tRNA ligase [Candidatus Saelkia tenebricola]